jgi:hypothetical protein
MAFACGPTPAMTAAAVAAKVYVGSVSGERAVVVVEAIVVARVVDSGSGSGGDDGVVGGGSSGGVASQECAARQRGLQDNGVLCAVM